MMMVPVNGADAHGDDLLGARRPAPGRWAVTGSR
jgi:hypothetical protein